MKQFDKSKEYNTTEVLTKEQADVIHTLVIRCGFEISTPSEFSTSRDNRITFSFLTEEINYFYDANVGGLSIEISFEDCKSILENIINEKQQESNKCISEKTKSVLDIQVGGDHYKKYKIQPMQYSMENNLDYCQSSVVKYVTRYKDKGGIKDLEKAKHCIDYLIERFKEND